MIIVRYADDVVLGFEHEVDALRFRDAMQERLQEFALSLNPDKTRLIEFGRHAADRRARRGLGKPETFKFLGFIFICARSRAGKFLLTRKSRPDRLQSKLQLWQPRNGRPANRGGLESRRVCLRLPLRRRHAGLASVSDLQAAALEVAYGARNDKSNVVGLWVRAAWSYCEYGPFSPRISRR